uniref:Uncharacterized protein n=1 Tax=Hyaloperonospora arabidopsidis (strain Emoy2) TaxID=559515 RepID=M4BCZ6_HYAAE
MPKKSSVARRRLLKWRRWEATRDGEIESVKPAAVENAAAPDAAVSALAGLTASSLYRAEAGRDQFQGSGCSCCERSSAPLARIRTDGASWISAATAFENMFSGCGRDAGY